MYQAKCDDTRNSNPLYFTTHELIQLCDFAENNLKIYIYPSNKTYCKQTRDYFKLEQKLPEYIRSSKVYTSNPLTADLFLIPHELVCSGMSKYNDSTYQSIYMNPLWSQFITSPYYQKYQGADHIFIYEGDNGLFCDTIGGACHIPYKYTKYLQNMIIIGNYGYSPLMNLSSGRVKPPVTRGCFSLNHDLVVPQYNSFYCEIPRPELSARDVLTVFWGNLVRGLECSPGARQALKHLKKSLSGQSRRIFEFQNRRIGPRMSFMSFCPAGHACWSSRLYDAICSHSIPIIIARGVIEPFERFFNWQKFTLKYDTEDLYHESFLSSFITPFFTSNHTRNRWKIAPHKREEVTAKLVALKVVAPWFSWQPKLKQNAWRLIILELFCRTKLGRVSAPCQQSSSTIALKTYGFND